MRAAIVLATPVLPPDASAHAKAGRVSPGGVGGVTGGGAMRGPEEPPDVPAAPGVTAALGASEGPHAVRIEISTSTRPIRTGQWYGRGPRGPVPVFKPPD